MKKTFSLIVLCMLVSCGTNLKVQTVVDKGYTSKLNDFGLFVQAPDNFWARELRNDIIIKLSQKDTTLKFVPNEDPKEPIKKMLSLDQESEDPSPLAQFIQVARKRQILIVDLKNLTTLNGSPTHLEAEGAVLDVVQRKIVWRFDLSGDRKTMGGDSLNDTASALIDRLQKDGLL